MTVVKPRALRQGDTVALVAPAGPPDRARTEAGVAMLARWGLSPVLGDSVFGGSRHGYLAAADPARVDDLHAAWGNPDVAGILALRGGYGTQRVIDRLDWDLIGANPKLVVGFSDCTTLLLALWQRTRQITIHGPGVAGDPRRLGTTAEGWFRALVMSSAPRSTLPATGRTLVGGTAEGRLLGGNLTMLSTSVGTADHPRLRDAVVLLEDVGERPYAVDRALLHLRRAGVLDGIAGLAFDPFHGCVEDRPGRRSATVEEVITEHASALGVPAVAALPLGHGPGQLAVPLGATCRLEADAARLTLTEAALR